MEFRDSGSYDYEYICYNIKKRFGLSGQISGYQPRSCRKNGRAALVELAESGALDQLNQEPFLMEAGWYRPPQAGSSSQKKWLLIFNNKCRDLGGHQF